MTAGLDRLHPVIVHHIVNSLGWRSLRPLQDQAADPVLDGADALLLAPTAGGKTEAAMFPLLTAMDTGGWPGMSVIYVCPLKALLNNLLPRLETYAGWLGRRVAIWHGDITASARQRILREPPDVLLTTPESLEAMLISLKVEHGRMFTDLRAIVIDEVHAFAGDDRGWHLLAVLERLTRVAAGLSSGSACRQLLAIRRTCSAGCREPAGTPVLPWLYLLTPCPPPRLRRSTTLPPGTRGAAPRSRLATSSWITWGQ